MINTEIAPNTLDAPPSPAASDAQQKVSNRALTEQELDAVGGGAFPFIQQ